VGAHRQIARLLAPGIRPLGWNGGRGAVIISGAQWPPAPSGTPRPIIEQLHREIVRACEKSRLREAVLQQAAVAVTSRPEEMTRHLEREIGVWREVFTRAKITVQ
jgi:tripartite-type tricarboxylate transporter receptor subunit TctC